MYSVVQNSKVKIYVVSILKDNLKKAIKITPTCFGSSWLHRASNNVEHFLLPTDAHKAKK